MEVIPSNVYLVLLLFIVSAYSSLCLMMIAHRLGAHASWMALIPGVNVYYLLRLADIPARWILLALVPFANIAIATYAFMVIAEKRGRPAWWGVFFIFPPTALMLQGALAFGDTGREHGHHHTAAPHVEV